MKQIILSVTVIALTTSSCKKSYNCVCSIIQPGVPNVAIPTVMYDTPAKAKKACYGLAKTIDSGGRFSLCTIQ